MDPDAQAIFAAASEDSGTPVESTQTQTPAEEPKEVPEPAKTETETPQETAKETETKTAPSQEEKTNKDGEPSEPTEAPAEVDWKSLLPPAPGEFQGKLPEVNEEGQVVNMTPQEYEDYLISRAEHRMSQRSYNQFVETKALEQVEKILPEIKENPTIRQMIENQRIADVAMGRNGDIVEAAKQIKILLNGAKAAGAQNTKVSIETQSAAAVETGNTQTKKNNSKGEDIARRINLGDSEAFVELLDIWQEEGVI